MTDAEIRAMLDAATKGPWKMRSGHFNDEEEIYPAEVDGKKRPAVGKWAEFAVVSRRPAAERKANARLMIAGRNFLGEEVLRLRAENARLHRAIARGRETCDFFDGPVSKSPFVNGQATVAQQIRAALGDAP
jgi:hypothetical protein